MMWTFQRKLARFLIMEFDVFLEKGHQWVYVYPSPIRPCSKGKGGGFEEFCTTLFQGQR